MGRKAGFSSDFGHVEMLLSKSAQQEVWPLVEYWLQQQSLPPAFRSPVDEVKL